jgi:DNA-binding HxlR family transcriptional regulator
MNYDWQRDLEMRRPSAAAFLPPALVAEMGWDILLALHSDRQSQLGLGKLASLASASSEILSQWLSTLEEQRLITGMKNAHSGELHATLTPAGRGLLDRYLSATNDLQVSTNH